MLGNVSETLLNVKVKHSEYMKKYRAKRGSENDKTKRHAYVKSVQLQKRM